MKKILEFDSAILLVLIATLLASPAYCADDYDRERITTEGEGEVEIQDQDLSRARGEALEDALQNAFENALVEILPQGLPLAGRQDSLDQLSPRLRRYLLQYRILSEMPALQVFFMNVEATFSVPLVREDLVKLGIVFAEEGTGEPVELFVRVERVSSFRWYQELVQLFQQMAHVRTATVFEVFGTAIVFRLEYERDLDDLLEAISSWSSEEFAFRVEQVKDQEVAVSLVTMPPGLMDR